MKTSKLLKKTEAIFEAKKSKQRKKVDSLKELLGALKKKKRKLHEKIEQSDDPDEKAKIQNELAVIRAQRHKGLELLKQIK
jgi:hypothetical protein